MSKKGKLINKIMDAIDEHLSERGLDDDYEWYFAKKTSVSDDPIILIEFPDGITRGFDVEWEDREDDTTVRSISELVTTNIMNSINEFESTRHQNAATRPIINFERREELLEQHFEQGFDEEAYESNELDYRVPEEEAMITEEPSEEFTQELADYYFSQAQEEVSL